MKRVTVTGIDTTVILNKGFYLPFCEKGYLLKSKKYTHMYKQEENEVCKLTEGFKTRVSVNSFATEQLRYCSMTDIVLHMLIMK